MNSQILCAAQDVCDTALKEFKALPRTGKFDKRQSRRQDFVEFEIYPAESSNKALGHITEHKIIEAMSLLAAHVPQDVRFENLDMPFGVEVAVKSEFLRFVMDYHIGRNSWQCRFDVLCSPRLEAPVPLALSA